MSTIDKGDGAHPDFFLCGSGSDFQFDEDPDHGLEDRDPIFFIRSTTSGSYKYELEPQHWIKRHPDMQSNDAGIANFQITREKSVRKERKLSNLIFNTGMEFCNTASFSPN